MTIIMLDQYCRAISRAKDTRKLSGLRSKLQGLLKADRITMSIYKGLNRDIRDRSDWLRNRGNDERDEQIHSIKKQSQ